MSIRSVRWVRVFVVMLSIWLTACSDTDNFQQYVAVIDAGSSGSRIYLYERSLVGSEVRVKSVFDRQGGLAMSSFEPLPTDAGPKGVQPLLDLLSPELAARGILPGKVQVHLLATAGMRLVERNNAATAVAIYASARQTLAASGMSVGRVETLSGAYEGIYSWLDINYLNGRLGGSGQPPLGIVEVGGASAQVAYVSSSTTDPQVIPVSFNGKTYRVFSVSWLGLGQNEARGAMISSTAIGGGTANNACYPANPSAAGGLTEFDAAINGAKIAAGSYNLTTCGGLYSGVVQSFNVRSASANADFAAARFVGVSSIYFALRDWKSLDNPALLDDNLAATCAAPSDWKTVSDYFGNTKTFAQNACANGTYIHSLLFGNQGLGVDPAKLTAVPDVNGEPLSWTRGFALIGQ